MRRSKGFTLFELLIVVAIVAILSTLAYPSYTSYVERTRRADGRDLLIRVAVAQERFFTNRNRYATSLADLGFGSGNSELRYYSLEEPEDAAQTFTLTAVPQDVQANDKCGSLSINNTGSKSFSGEETNGKCW